MNLNHINLPVADIAASRDFFVKYLGMKVVFERGEMLAILRDESGLILNLSHFDKASEIRYHKDFHIGFFLNTREEAQSIYDQMLADGLSVGEPKKAQGRWTFYVNAPGGFEVEVGTLEGNLWSKP